MRPLRTVHLSTTFEMWEAGALVGRMEGRLGYDPSDPFAVTMDFGAGVGNAPLWCCDRLLLLDGMTAPCGLGDVRVRPMAGHPGLTQVELHSPTGYARLAVATAELDAFLGRTFLVVPPDSEYASLDVDQAIREFLHGAPHHERP